MLIHLALPEGSRLPCSVDAEGEPTGDSLPAWVEERLNHQEREGLIPGGYAALWSNFELRVVSWDDSAEWPPNIEELWRTGDKI